MSSPISLYSAAQPPDSSAMSALEEEEGKKRMRSDDAFLLSSSPQAAVPPAKRASLLLSAEPPHPNLQPLEASPSPCFSFLEELCETSSVVKEEEEGLVIEMMRSLEKEIGGATLQGVEAGAIVSSEDSVRQHFEASDDGLGLPSMSISPVHHSVADVRSTLAAAEDLSFVAWALPWDCEAPASHEHSTVFAGWPGKSDGAVSDEGRCFTGCDYLYGDLVTLNGHSFGSHGCYPAVLPTKDGGESKSAHAIGRELM